MQQLPRTSLTITCSSARTLPLLVVFLLFASSCTSLFATVVPAADWTAQMQRAFDAARHVDPNVQLSRILVDAQDAPQTNHQLRIDWSFIRPNGHAVCVSVEDYFQGGTLAVSADCGGGGQPLLLRQPSNPAAALVATQAIGEAFLAKYQAPHSDISAVLTDLTLEQQQAWHLSGGTIWYIAWRAIDPAHDSMELICIVDASTGRLVHQEERLFAPATP